MLLNVSNDLGIESLNKFFLTAVIISFAVDSAVTNSNKLGKLFKIVLSVNVYKLHTVASIKCDALHYPNLPNYRFFAQTGVHHIRENRGENGYL